ncbi:amidohydrolase [Variovorax paradoxus]|nr:amidohydrolase family protein [Variovorax paradoxus]MBT2305087.1 amidohydrolase [Variovorax paradoxus]
MSVRGKIVIAVEEHYADGELTGLLRAPRTALSDKLEDFVSLRLQEMDAAGIDIQVLSHAPPGLQAVSAVVAPDLARRVNDRLAAVVEAHPARFAAFASLPTAAPGAAVRELERAVTVLGFRGAMIHGLTEGCFLDERKFWPILEAAEALDVPIYLHPSDPHPAVFDAYFGSYAVSHPMFARAAWGYTMETGTHAMRLILSGALDAYPKLKLILGHMGEAIPFLISRIDEAFSRGNQFNDFRRYFTEHFYVTTSGFFSDAALLCCLQELGADRIMFAVDWPYVSNRAGSKWIERVSLSEHDREKILNSNARRLLRLEGSRAMTQLAGS